MTQIGQQFARELGLENPETYCGQSFRVAERVPRQNHHKKDEKTKATLAEKKKPHSVASRRSFRQCRQGAGETVEVFIGRLRSLAESCGFCGEVCLDENLLEQLVEGLRDRDVAEQLLNVPDLNLETAMGICELYNDGDKEEAEETLGVPEKDLLDHSIFDLEGEEGVDENDKDIGGGDTREPFEDIAEELGTESNSNPDEEKSEPDESSEYKRHLEDIFDEQRNNAETSEDSEDEVRDETDILQYRHGGGQTRFKCPHCTYTSVSKINFISHNRTVHGAVVKDKRRLESRSDKAARNIADEDRKGVQAEAEQAAYQPDAQDDHPDERAVDDITIKVEKSCLSPSSNSSNVKKEPLDPSRTEGTSRVTADDIQGTITAALQKKEDLSPRHLLEIMQRIVEFQKKSIAKEEDLPEPDGRAAVVEVSPDTSGESPDTSGELPDASSDTTDPFSENFTPVRVTNKLKKGKMIATGPSQDTIRTYEFSWKNFEDFRHLPENESRLGVSAEPTEGDYVTYFNFLYEVKGYKTATLWSIFSNLNYNHQKKFKRSIQELSPKIADRIRTYESLGMEKMTKSVGRVFTREQIHKALRHNPKHPLEPPSSWIVRRAAISVAFCGSLSLQSLKKIKLSCVKVDEQGVWITTPVNRVNLSKDDKFLVPFHTSKHDPCPASTVITYLDRLHKYLPDLGPSDDLFHRARKDDSFRVGAMSRDALGEIGQEVASMLGLENPEAYNNNSFKLLPKDGSRKRRGRMDLEPGDMKEIMERYSAKKRKAPMSSSSGTEGGH